MSANNQSESDGSVVKLELAIYVAQHCETCAYAHEIANLIRSRFPQVSVRLIDVETSGEEIPEAVFAIPTYLIDGRVWSLGNPSPQQALDMFAGLTKTLLAP